MKPFHFVRAEWTGGTWTIIDDGRYISKYLQDELNAGYMTRKIDVLNLDGRHLLVHTAYAPKEARQHPSYKGPWRPWWARIFKRRRKNGESELERSTDH